MIKTGELCNHLMVIRTQIQCMEEFGASSIQDVRTQFESTAARFAVYLSKYHTGHLLSRLVHAKAMIKEKRTIEEKVKHLHTLINAPDVNPVLEMDGFLQIHDYSHYPESMSLLTKHDMTYSDDSTTENSSTSYEMLQETNQLRASQQGHKALMDSSFTPDDETIAKAQIPRDEIVVEAFISRGAFGEVYKGTYKGQTVAVKTMNDVEVFMKEIKMTIVLNHPNIVQCIGVAWNSRDDICCVMEYMNGGDLRTLLSQYTEQNCPKGFDSRKLMIAFQVARALVYLHSRNVPVIHRDLKSKNILLNEVLDAKVTDFGVSRDRAVGQMTANIGTSLWMAPEVMLGDPYDEKADMFSFGVVLSELSMHALPYSHAQIDHGGNPQLVILRRVAMGDLRVEFSKTGPQSIVKLGLLCVSMDIKKRPTANEAMRVLHTALIQEARDEFNS